MYKVFFDKKVIILTENSINNCKSVKNQTIKIDENSRIDKIICDFEQNDIMELVLVYSSEKKLYKKFKSEFKMIKAAGGVVKNPIGEFLVIRKRNKWDLPKGKSDKGEKARQTALREVKEECGLTDLEITQKLSPTYHVYDHKGQRILKKTKWFEMINQSNEKPIPQTQEKITEAKWVKISELETIKQNTYTSLIEILNQIN